MRPSSRAWPCPHLRDPKFAPKNKVAPVWFLCAAFVQELQTAESSQLQIPTKTHCADPQSLPCPKPDWGLLKLRTSRLARKKKQKQNLQDSSCSLVAGWEVLESTFNSPKENAICSGGWQKGALLSHWAHCPLRSEISRRKLSSLRKLQMRETVNLHAYSCWGTTPEAKGSTLRMLGHVPPGRMS